MADYAEKAPEEKPKDEEPKGDEKAGDDGDDDGAVVEVCTLQYTIVY